MTEEGIDLTARQVLQYFEANAKFNKVEWEVISDLKKIIQRHEEDPDALSQQVRDLKETVSDLEDEVRSLREQLDDIEA